MSAPEFESLPDAWSGEPPTDRERQLLKDVGCNLGSLAVRALRTGHEAGRRSVLHAPVRVWRKGDPPPECAVTLLDCDGLVVVWDPALDDSLYWPRFLVEAGDPLVEFHVDYYHAVAADAARRAALEEGAL